MLDLREETKSFKPVDIASLSASDMLYTESMRIAFTLYNKALQEIEEGYRDLAKNNLRKAVSHYPEFGDAMIVLGICTFINGDRVGAVRVFNSVKTPEDRARGMKILDHLAASGYTSVTSEASSSETKGATPLAGDDDEYDIQVSHKNSMSRDKAIVRDEQQSNRQNQTMLRNDTEDDEHDAVVRYKDSSLATKKEQREPKEQRVSKEPRERYEKNEKNEQNQNASASSSIIPKNKFLMAVCMILAACTIFFAAAYMKEHAENEVLRSALSSSSTTQPQTTVRPQTTIAPTATGAATTATSDSSALPSGEPQATPNPTGT